MTVTLDLSRGSATPAPAPVNLAGLTRGQLSATLVDGGICPPEKARMRTTQMWRWMHNAGVTTFDGMTDIDKATRGRLAERVDDGDQGPVILIDHPPIHLHPGPPLDSHPPQGGAEC